MKFLRQFAQLDGKGSVLTIGAFDGLHRGHHEILDRVLESARARGLQSLVLSFEPTPKEFFSKQKSPARLMRFREKFLTLQALGIDVFCCPRFDLNIANLSADDFVKKLLVDRLGVRHLIVGDDFQYAKNREGDFRALTESGYNYGFDVSQTPSIEVDGQRVSSTLIRELLHRGDMQGAQKMLGRPFSMSGRVIRGKQLGRTLGFPTANLAISRRVSPVHGIYAVRVRGLGPAALPAVASIGTRPTVDNGRVLLEVHLFDFSEDIYGKAIEVEFVEYLRREEKFDDLDTLVDQMHIDADNARTILAA
ncbi:MAG: bifunctional riboflavin kinase/FAD synthetase [Pseudomonadota bacterium]